MPTGYTSEIEQGITFQQFAMRCARAFGALIMMRDDPMDAVIPDEFIPSEYHTKEITKEEAELAKIRTMSPPAVKKAIQAEFDAELKSIDDMISKSRNTKSKYEAMLCRVKGWTPPTPDHIELKNFMIKQIEESISFDCSGGYWEDKRRNLTLRDVQDWRQAKIKQHLDSIAYHQKEYKAEVDRCAFRSKWVRELRESLKEK